MLRKIWIQIQMRTTRLFTYTKLTQQSLDVLDWAFRTVQLNSKSTGPGITLISESIVIRTYSLETRAEPAVLRTYVENQAIMEPILLYRASNCKQTKEQFSEECLWTHIFTFL